MASVYILSNRGKLSKEEDHLLFKDYKSNCTKILPRSTERIFIMGNSCVTGDAMNLLMRFEIPVSYITHSGKNLGHITYSESKNIFLRQKQFLLSADEEKSLQIAKSIVTGKIKNQLAFVQRIKRSRGSSEEIENAIIDIKNFLKDVERAQTKDSLRGTEGMAARTYFSALRKNIIPEWAVFEKRSKNPPESNVNAVLSFLYSLLENYTESIIRSHDLDTMLGNLHEMSYGQTTLAFDLMEEFRTPIADTLMCSLFNKGVLCAQDFKNIEISGKNAVYLTEDGIKKVCKSFEEKILGSVMYEATGKKLNFLQIINEQVKLYKKIVLGEEQNYKSFYYK